MFVFGRLFLAAAILCLLAALPSLWLRGGDACSAAPRLSPYFGCLPTTTRTRHVAELPSSIRQPEARGGYPCTSPSSLSLPLPPETVSLPVKARAGRGRYRRRGCRCPASRAARRRPGRRRACCCRSRSRGGCRRPCRPGGRRCRCCRGRSSRARRARSRRWTAERRRSRTYPAVGYTTSPVLKTGWATGPMPVPGAERSRNATGVIRRPRVASRGRSVDRNGPPADVSVL